ncbi:transglutaminase-like domain-containing protein [Alkalicaulis satelles]|nr:transglutaminase-like domain-containing protein [Alkalicaulis satelles]
MVSFHFDPWGFADDDAIEVLLPLPSADGYQTIHSVDAPEGIDFIDQHGHRRLIRLERGKIVNVTAQIETRRLTHGSYLDLPPPVSADLADAPMILPDEAIRKLVAQGHNRPKTPDEQIAGLAKLTACALRYKYPRDSRGAAVSLGRRWGDCGEYAFLFVALCRASGIPARPVFGMIIAPWMKTPHAWAEAWNGKGWLPVDPNLVREGFHLGPILEAGRRPADHIGALDPYRLVLSRHTGLPWPGYQKHGPAHYSCELTQVFEGLGPVTIWHQTPLWRGESVVPFLQLPWTVIHRPKKASLVAWCRRMNVWNFSVIKPNRRLPRNFLVMPDLLVLHPIKGVAGVVMAGLLIPVAPSVAFVFQIAIWTWFCLVIIGLIKSLRLMILRSPVWNWMYKT